MDKPLDREIIVAKWIYRTKKLKLDGYIKKHNDGIIKVFSNETLGHYKGIDYFNYPKCMKDILVRCKIVFSKYGEMWRFQSEGIYVEKPNDFKPEENV